MRTCHEMGRWLQHYLDNELDVTTAAQVREHLLECVKCGMEFDTFQRIVDTLRETPDDQVLVLENTVSIERLRHFAEQLTNHSGQ